MKTTEINLPESFIAAVETLGFDIPDLATANKSFSFHRRKRDGLWGWVIHFRIGRLTLGDCDWAERPFPRRRIDAERWAIEFARNGFEPVLDSIRPKRRPVLRLVINNGGRACE